MRILPGGRTFSLFGAPPVMWTAIRKPFSHFAETIRAAIVAIDLGRMQRKLKVVAVVSSGQGEGKTTTAVNLAASLAQSGHKVLLVDLDLRRPQLTRVLTPDASSGLLEVLAGKEKLETVVWQDQMTGMLFLPAVLSVRPKDVIRVLGSSMMQQLFAEAESLVDYVIVDTAPTGPVVDVKAFAHMVDGFVFCAAWSKTSRHAVELLAEANFLRSQLLGTVLTLVDAKIYRMFETYDDSYHRETD